MAENVDLDGPIPVSTVCENLDRAVARFGARPAADFLGKKYSYAEIDRLVRHATRGFQELGVSKGVRVGLCLPNTPYYLVCYYAILRAGGTVVNFNPLYAEREMEHLVEDSGTTIMVTLDLRQIYPKVAALLGRTCLERIVLCRMGDILPPVKGLLFSVLKRGEIAATPADSRHIPFPALIANDGRPEPVALDPATDLAVLQYTGGTTGTPKGAMLTHANVFANAEQVSRWLPDCHPGEERMLGVLPFFHVFAMTVVMNFSVATAAEIIMLPRFQLDQVLKCIAKRRPTLFPAVPTIYNAICAAEEGGRHDLSSIRFCISGGAPLPVEVRHRFEELTGCRLVEGYGLSEASPVVTCNPLDGVNKDGSIGLPLPHTVVEVRSLDDPRKVLGPGEKGEICVRGPQVMAGYWDRPDATEECFVDGALRTGDVGYVDEEGYVFLVDRIKDVIICGGFNVYPRVIEEALYQHDAVAEAVVIGVPDDYRGQAPKAFVRLKPDHEAGEDEIKAFLAQHISRIEMPREVEFRDELPKTMIGKLSRKELVAEEAAKYQQRKAAKPGAASTAT